MFSVMWVTAPRGLVLSVLLSWVTVNCCFVAVAAGLVVFGAGVSAEIHLCLSICQFMCSSSSVFFCQFVIDFFLFDHKRRDIATEIDRKQNKTFG